MKYFLIHLSNLEESGTKKIYKLNLNKYQSFINEYREIFPDQELTIYLNGGDPTLLLDDVKELLKNSKRIQYVLLPRLKYVLDEEHQELIEGLPCIIRYDSNNTEKMQIFLENLKKIKNKGNKLISLKKEDYSSESSLITTIRFLHNYGYDKFIIDGEVPESLDEDNVMFIMDPLQNLDYEIDFLGNIYDMRKSEKKSTIFKNVGYLLF